MGLCLKKMNKNTTYYIQRAWAFFKKNNPNYIIFFIFLGIASFFWLLNALGKTYTITIPYTFEYRNIPKNFTPAESSQHKVYTHVTGSGYVLLRYYAFDRFFVIPIDAGEFISDTTKPVHPVHINTLQKLQSRVSQSLLINTVDPTEITGKISIISQKKVPVFANTLLECRNNFEFITSHTIVPDSIELKGAKIILDTIKRIYTELYERSDIHSSFSTTLNLIPIPGLRLEKSNVRFSTEVDEKLFKIIELPLDISLVPERKQDRISESRVIISYSVFASEYTKSIDTTIKAIADYKPKLFRQTKIPIRVHNIPSTITILSVEPAEISYLTID